jgi:hypothetical protein
VAVHRRRWRRKRTGMDPSEAPSALNLTRIAVEGMRANSVHTYTLPSRVRIAKADAARPLPKPPAEAGGVTRGGLCWHVGFRWRVGFNCGG